MDANERLHRDWLGMAQPEGLVVTLASLKAAEANITWPVTELQAQVRELTHEGRVFDLRAFFRDILEWSDEYIVDRSTLPASLAVTVEEGDNLVPSYALKSADDEGSFVFLVTETLDGTDLDAAYDERRWTASAHQRFERLLRETGLGVGLLTNGRDFRLVFAPKGESAGWITFRLSEMLSVDGRPLLGAFHMLLNERRLLTLKAEKRLLAHEEGKPCGLLPASRAYQNTVSTALREQVLGALRTLLQGFQAADNLAEGRLLRDYRGEAMREVYLGLVTVLMRMVFVLFAEERDLLPMSSDLYAESYSLTKLYAQLLKDHGEHGDGLAARYGAWARVLTLFRVLHDGLKAPGGLKIPAREGKLFNPDEFPFLEGRPRGSARQKGEKLPVPRVSDGVLYRVLDQLFVLDGERLQYKGLDVEQIGSVYEGLMGFEIEVAEGDSLCLSPEHVVVNLEKLLKLPGADRLKQLKAEANLDVKDKAGNEVKAATTAAALHAALGRRISQRQPGLLPKGTLYLQPGEERRRSGSHYTPRSLTQPIVETTLRPVLERLSGSTQTPYALTPEQILDLKICDPAMGSGAFLVEVCRQLADHLVAAWRKSGVMPDLPPDEDPLLHARRLVAQKCIYGVDKNPLAVDLARLSMWLVTFAKEHPFTFVDHSLRCGDSLVGLSREQITDLTPYPLSLKGEGEEKEKKTRGKKAAEKAAAVQLDLVRPLVAEAVSRADALRKQIHAIGDPPDNAELRRLWQDTNDALAQVRLLGDAVIACYFAHDTDKARKAALETLHLHVQNWLSSPDSSPPSSPPPSALQGEGGRGGEVSSLAATLLESSRPLQPFHWEIEFPEVFGRENPGFDCFVGNPPFLGGTRISQSNGLPYKEWLTNTFAASGLTDLAAFFFRQTFGFLRRSGTSGLVATNSIAQGDSRTDGLSWICRHEGCIYSAVRRLRWPGSAAVVVSVVHFGRALAPGPAVLDGKSGSRISAYLLEGATDDTPKKLLPNEGVSVIGSFVLGIGFVFEDDNPGATPLGEMNRLVVRDSRNAERIFGYLGGEELNSDPHQLPRRYVIDFGEMTEAQAREWPDLFRIVETKVKPARSTVQQRDRRELWWLHATRSPELRRFLRDRERFLALSQVTTHLVLAFVPKTVVVPHTTVAFLLGSSSAFTVLQSTLHDKWARFLGSSLGDGLRYTPTDCFETFPFPPSLYPLGSPPPSPTLDALEAIGKEYYEFRAALMADEAIRFKLMDGTPPEGLTKTYNKFHDPDCHLPGIVRLRELHAQMDRAVLDAYGWQDIRPEYDFREQLDESIRLTWAEETRDEVLARLLELNRVMAEGETSPPSPLSLKGRGGGEGKKTEAGEGEAPKKGRGRKKKDEPEGQGGLFS